jgi:hypothetical protein
MIDKSPILLDFHLADASKLVAESDRRVGSLMSLVAGDLWALIKSRSGILPVYCQLKQAGSLRYSFFVGARR